MRRQRGTAGGLPVLQDIAFGRAPIDMDHDRAKSRAADFLSQEQLIDSSSIPVFVAPDRKRLCSEPP